MRNQMFAHFQHLPDFITFPTVLFGDGRWGPQVLGEAAQ